MRIRSKIIVIVLPLLVAALLITGIISSYSARSGLTRLAMASMGFKAQELNKYMDNQWNLLVNNNLAEDADFIEVTKSAVLSYAGTLVRSGTEIIFAVNQDGHIAAATSSLAMGIQERARLYTLSSGNTTGWITFLADGRERVGHAFIFEPFGWYVVVSDEAEAFYREVTDITRQNFIVLGVSVLVSIIFLLSFAGYLTRPLTRVVRVMKDIIQYNDLSRRVEVEYKDEIGELANTFNIMITELDRAYLQIKEFALKAVLAQKNEHKIRNIFQRYVPKDVIDTIFENPESMLVGDNRVVAILFSDIRSFTTISEGFMPDELVKALNRYFEMMVDIIMARGGIIDKYIGDAIMAFYGAPVKHDDDALQAVLSGLEMQSALVEFNKAQITDGKPAFNTGIGINYGVCTVGNIGSDKKMDYTIIGDMVNLGSRLEGLTKPYKQKIIFSESVHRKVEKDLVCRMIDRVQVKGKTQGENIWTAEKELPEKERKAWDYHNAGMELYYRLKFEQALKYFEAVRKILPEDYVSGMFMERCQRYIAEPPSADWNGVEILTSK
ncbi:MAG: HAMP domain-containing protein [Spirochaetales bacterium]|nr:HAMP domain-containing protein [Spirochaetales bacterium]